MKIEIEDLSRHGLPHRSSAEERAATIARLGFLLSAASDPAQAARCVIETALDFFQWDASFLHLYNSEADIVSELVNMDTIGGERQEVPAVLADKRPSSLFRRVMQSGPQLILRHNETDMGPPTVRFGDVTRLSMSLMFVPVRLENRSIGVLSVQSYERDAYTAQDLEMLQGLADHVAGAFARLQAQSELRASEERLRLAIESAQLGTWDYDPRTGELELSPRCKELFGMPLNARPDPAAFMELVNPEDRKALEKAAMKALDPKGHGEFDAEYRARRSDGTERWLVARGKVFFGLVKGERAPARFTGTVLDVTERRQMEEQLRELSQRLTYHVDNSPLAIVEWGADMRLTRWSGAAERVFGWKASEVLGKRMEEFRWVYQADLSKVIENSAGLQTGSDRSSFSANRNYRKDGTVVHCEWYNSALVDESGNLRSVLSLVLDVTERKHAESALNEAQAQLQAHASELEKTVAARTAKLTETITELEHFSYALTHDMRAPLRAMATFAQLLEDECRLLGNPAILLHCDRIKSSAHRLDQLIRDSLNYSRAVLDELPTEPVPLDPLIRGLIDSYPNLQPEKADIHIEGDLPIVRGNHAGLTQCFSNLLGNAVKFVRPETRPRVHIWAEPRGKKVRVWIQDNGIGIPKIAQNHIFEMFQRATNAYEGTGIGLAIVRKVLQRIGGSVGVESEEGKGSRFWVELLGQ